MGQKERSAKMRELHRYLGFFLAGIMAVYAISGVTLIFRDSDVFKKKISYDKVIEKNVSENKLGKELGIRRLKVTKNDGGILYFKGGTYDSNTGRALYDVKKVPYVLDKLQHLHKAKSADPLYYLNIFFGLSLLFFVISSFFMFLPGSSIFKKGLYFTLAGMVLTLILLFV